MGTLYWIGITLMMFGFFGFCIPYFFEMEADKAKIFLIIEGISLISGIILLINN